MAEALLAPMPAVVMVYAVIALGFALQRRGPLGAGVERALTWLLVNVLFPAFIVGKLLGSDQFADPAALAVAPALGFASTIAGYGLGLLAAHGLGGRIGLTTPQARRAFALTAGMANYGYLPIPLAEQLAAAGRVPQGTVSTLLVHNVGVDVAMWSVGVLVVSGHFERRALLRLLNPPLIAIAAVVALNLSGVGFADNGPAGVAVAWLGTTGTFLGGAAVPVALLMTGAIVADCWAEADLRRGLPTMAAGAAVRLGLMPPVILAMAMLLPPGQAPLRAVAAIEAAMPSALFPIVLARVYGADPATAVRVALATACLAFVTIPLWLAAGLALL